MPAAGDPKGVRKRSEVPQNELKRTELSKQVRRIPTHTSHHDAQSRESVQDVLRDATYPIATAGASQTYGLETACLCCCYCY